MTRKLFWILAFLLAWLGRDGLRAQNTTQDPDCKFPIGLITAAGSTGPFDNRTLGCTSWVFTYNSTGFSVLSLVVQTAPNAAGVPGAWSTFTAVGGINPNTAITEAVTTFGGSTSYFPWLRVTLSSKTGTGSISGLLYGWKIPPTPPPGSGGCVGTATTPCIVAGPNAINTPSTKAPVQIAGIETTNTGNVIPVLVNASGAVGTVNKVTLPADSKTADQAFMVSDDGIDAAPLGVAKWVFKGSNQFNKEFACTNQALFNLSGSGDTQIIAASGATIIKICHISFSTVSAEDVKITRGTGVNCGTGTADVTGLYKSVTAMALDFQPTAALRGAASGAICLNQSVAQALGGVVIYAQF